MRNAITLRPAATRRTLGNPIAEAALHDAVIAKAEGIAPRIAERARLVIAQDLQLLYGRPDVVIAWVDSQSWRRRRRLNIDACTAPLALATAMWLRDWGGIASTSDLVEASEGKLSGARARSGLATLEKHGWVRRSGGRFVLRSDPGESLLTASAVEAKLNNWRRAVRQAQSWETYFDATWLAFPASYLRHVPRTPALRRFGLIQVADSGAELMRKPRGRRATGIRHVLTEEFLYARWLIDTSRS